MKFLLIHHLFIEIWILIHRWNFPSNEPHWSEDDNRWHMGWLHQCWWEASTIWIANVNFWFGFGWHWDELYRYLSGYYSYRCHLLWLIDAYGQKLLYKEPKSSYLELLEAQCIPTEDTYALLLTNTNVF